MAERVPAYEGKEPFLFASYAHLDGEKVLPIIESFFKDKYRVWYDEGIAPGSEWPKNIEDHLKAATGVIVFTSNASLQSLNCANEVKNALNNGKIIYRFQIDSAQNSLLDTYTPYTSYDQLIADIPSNYLGDGVTGYQHEMGKIKSRNAWTSLIVLAVVLILLLIIGILGLERGWFDSYLPGLNTEVIEEVQQEVIEVPDIVEKGYYVQTDQLSTDPIDFENDESREILYRALNLNPEDIELSTQNLYDNNVESLYFDEINDEVLNLLYYFRSLHTIEINGGKITSLDPLTKCSSLKTLRLASSLFPIDIPENLSFTLELL